MKKFLTRRLGVSDDLSTERPTLQACIEAVLEQSGALMDDVIKGLDLAVSQVGGKVSKVGQQTLSRQVVEALRQQAAAVRATFGVQLRLAIYRSGGQTSDPDALVRFEDLQLLDENQIDANIEFAMAQQEIQMAADEVLPPLNALVSSLMGWLSVQAHLNPLRPETFARALRATLLQHVPSEEMRTALIAPAASILGNSLRQLYKELVDWLRSQGVEPVVPLLTAGSQTNVGAPVENPVSRTMLTLDKLRRLLSGELDGGAEVGMKDFLHTVPASMVALEDLKMVEPMMKRLSERAKLAPGGGGDKVAKTSGKEKNQSRKLGQQLGEEVVRLMLENLMKDERLLTPVRAQIKSIAPMLLRLSQTDPRFFSEKKHPARQLLDRITHQSLGYKTENDERFQRFLKTVEKAVRELTSSQGEADSFARALTMLDAQWSRVDMELRAKQEEVARALVHAEQRNLLAQRLAADFHARMQDKKIPELVASFICGPWSQVVAESQLSGKVAAEDAQGYLTLVDDLIWSVQTKLAQRNRARLVQLVPNLLVTLRQGLQLIQYPEEKIPHFFDELIALHEKAFEGPRVKKPKAASAPPGRGLDLPEEMGGPVVGLEVTELSDMPDDLSAEASQEPEDDSTGYGPLEAPDADAVWVAGPEAAEAGYLPEGEIISGEQAGEAALPGAWNAADLTIGCWVELQLKGEWVRAQLTWASPHRTLFMFISGKGLAHSMSRRTMEQLRSRGFMRVVSDRHVVDNALDAVAQAALLNARKPGKS